MTARLKLLAAEHKGMKVDYRGLLQQARVGLHGQPALSQMLQQLQDHLTELGRRWYAGDAAAVDELLQLYCVEPEARAALTSTALLAESSQQPCPRGSEGQVKDALENLDAAVRRALEQEPPGRVLACVTGIFVGLTVELCRREGADVNKDITIDGGPNRDITIHAPKLAASTQEVAQ